MPSRMAPGLSCKRVAGSVARSALVCALTSFFTTIALP